MAKVNLKLVMPDSLRDITLGQYQEYNKILENNKDDENAGDFLNLKALEVFCGLKLKESYNLPIKHFHFALSRLEDCFKEDTPLQKTFTFRDSNGVEQEMGFIPKLDDMTAGEYMDLDGYIGDWNKMHKAMAILYRPIRIKSKKDYMIADYEGTETYAEVMKLMPVSYAIGALVFFYRLGIKLLNAIPQYLEREAERSSLSKEDLQKLGDGIRLYTPLLEETLYSLIAPPKFLYTKP